MTLESDQLGETATYNYQMANRLLSRDYRTRPDSPGGAVADSDSFTYDDASRLLTADSGRYGNDVAFTYNDDSTLASEALTTNGQTSRKRRPSPFRYSVDTSGVEVESFSSLQDFIDKHKDELGTYVIKRNQGKGRSKYSDVYKVQGNKKTVLGQITLKAWGKLKVKEDCTWSFDGHYAAYYDRYDFNSGADRGVVGEILTWIGSTKEGKPYFIRMKGKKPLKGSGKNSGSGSGNQNGGGYYGGWYYYFY